MTATRRSVAPGSAGRAPGAAGGPGELPEQTRARYPDAEGYVTRDGVRVFWERYGDRGPDVLLLPTYSIVSSRAWKAQIPYLARHCRVVTFDGRGNGRSDRPVGAEAYTADEFAADALAVMEATGLSSAVLVSTSCGALWATILAAEHPDRVEGVVYLAPAMALAPGHPERAVHPFDRPVASTQGWAKYNSHYWQREYRDFLEFFAGECFSEPHSTKQIEDFVGWGLGTTPAALADATRGIGRQRIEPIREACGRVRCPTLVIHGDDDHIRPHRQGAALARATGGRMVTLEGAGHLPQVRDPVRVNLLLRDFVGPPPPTARWRRAPARARRALYISSPIGLGHARRDIAIATELRRLRPDLEIDWLAQHPVSEMLSARGENIHPASSELAGESAHIASEASGHALPVFEAWRRMDEILLANFMVFHDVVREEAYDLWIGDEAWELDFYLHENPELKTAAYAWLTDFVGWLPTPGGGTRESELTADLNAQMIEQVERYPRVRDRAIFVGEPDDIVPDDFGPGLPRIRDWTERHFRFAGHVTGFTPPAPSERAALRERLGYAADEPVCVVSVGGSGVGEALLRRMLDTFPLARRLIPRLRMIVIAGPRIDASSLPAQDGLALHGFVPDLHEHLAASDLAVVQGGLTTTMELAANRRPFLYFPLAGHFEQTGHVAYRLARLGAGRRMDFEASPPEAIARAMAEELGAEPAYGPVAADGAQRAAAIIAELL